MRYITFQCCESMYMILVTTALRGVTVAKQSKAACSYDLIIPDDMDA